MSGGNDVLIGLVGVGAMGKGLLYQSTITPGVRCAAVCDVQVGRATRALDAFGLPYEVVHHPSAIPDVIRRGRVAVCDDGSWLAKCDGVDVLIEATSSIADGARVVIESLRRPRPVVLMNSEIDLLYGPLFADIARRHGTVCTSCDGDQYGALGHLIDEIRGWGFELVMAGNIKGFLDRSVTPVSIAEEADKRHLDHRMCAAFTDGTKLNIEMAILANAYDLRPTRPGMVGPALSSVNEVLAHFDFDELRARPTPCVDYILGAEPGGGVFVVGHCDHPYQRQMLEYYKMGPGPFYVFYRPHHLAHIEAMRGVIDAVRHHHVLMAPHYGLRTNVYAYAKRDLDAGTRLDDIGGHCCYGLIESTADSTAAPGLPAGLSDGTVLRRRVGRDEKIYVDDIDLGTASSSFRLFEQSVAAPAVRTGPRSAP